VSVFDVSSRGRCGWNARSGPLASFEERWARFLVGGPESDAFVPLMSTRIDIDSLDGSSGTGSGVDLFLWPFLHFGTL